MQGGYSKAGTTRHGKRELNTPYATKIRDILQKNSASTSTQDPQCTKGVAQHNEGQNANTSAKGRTGGEKMVWR